MVGEAVGQHSGRRLAGRENIVLAWGQSKLFLEADLAIPKRARIVTARLPFADNWRHPDCLAVVFHVIDHHGHIDCRYIHISRPFPLAAMLGNVPQDHRTEGEGTDRLGDYQRQTSTAIHIRIPSSFSVLRSESH